MSSQSNTQHSNGDTSSASVYPWSSDSWLTICGRTDEDAARSARARAKSVLAAKGFTDHNVSYLNKVSYAVCPVGESSPKLSLSDEQLQKLRLMCQLWDVDLRPADISSHRPYIGPIIVKAKRFMFRLLQVLLKDFFRQQRAFNAATISFVAALNSEADEERSPLVAR